LSLSNAHEIALLDLILGAQAYTPSATLWISLYTVAPTDAGGGTEVTGGSYARVAVDNDLVTWAAAASGSKANAIVIAFPQATADWGTVVAWAAHEHVTNDDIVVYGTITPNRAILNGAEPEFAIGDLVVTAD
jgi:hypothetical protein